MVIVTIIDYINYNDIAPKLYHNFGGRVKPKCRRWSTLNRRLSGSFHNDIKNITVPDSRTNNDIDPITLLVL